MNSLHGIHLHQFCWCQTHRFGTLWHPLAPLASVVGPHVLNIEYRSPDCTCEWLVLKVCNQTHHLTWCEHHCPHNPNKAFQEVQLHRGTQQVQIGCHGKWKMEIGKWKIGWSFLWSRTWHTRLMCFREFAQNRLHSCRENQVLGGSGYRSRTPDFSHGAVF